jgi:hypothetical protein
MILSANATPAGSVKYLFTEGHLLDHVGHAWADAAECLEIP